MKKPNKGYSVFLRLIVFVFLVAFTSSCLLGMFGYIMYKLELFSPNLPPHVVWAICLICCTIACTLIAGCFGRKALKPIFELKDAMKEVAKGDFSVRLEENQKMTEMIEVAVIFNKMVSELDSIEMLRSDFIANISHEFKTPLSAIEGYSCLLLDEKLSAEEKQAYVKIIEESTQQLSKMVSMILQLSKLENQKLSLEKKKFRLDEQIREALVSLESRWSEKNIDLDIVLETAECISYEELLKPVWLNLMDNAIKFSHTDGKIRIELYKKASSIVVKIKDEGIGMTKEVQNHIFEKFYQADRSRAKEGNGLGLALVNDIILICQGRIEVESEQGLGSCFTVELPFKEKEMF